MRSCLEKGLDVAIARLLQRYDGDFAALHDDMCSLAGGVLEVDDAGDLARYVGRRQVTTASSG